MGIDDDLAVIAYEKAHADENGEIYNAEDIEVIRLKKLKQFRKPQTLPVIDRQLRALLPEHVLKDKKYGRDDEDAAASDDGEGDEGDNPQGAGARKGVALGGNDTDEEYDQVAMDKKEEQKLYKWQVQYDIHQKKGEVIRTQELLKKDDMIVG